MTFSCSYMVDGEIPVLVSLQGVSSNFEKDCSDIRGVYDVIAAPGHMKWSRTD